MFLVLYTPANPPKFAVGGDDPPEDINAPRAARVLTFNDKNL